MACRWRTLLVLCFFNRFWVERGVDRGRSVVKRNVSELANLPLEGYFRALYTPLGGWRDTAFPPSMKLYFSMFNDKPPWRKKAFSTSTKLCFSMFRDNPPCMPLCFGTADCTARGGWGVFLFS